MLVCDKSELFSAEVTKAIWVYIKKKGLNKGRIISPDATLKTVLPVASSACMGAGGETDPRIRQEARSRARWSHCKDLHSWSWRILMWRGLAMWVAALWTFGMRQTCTGWTC